LTFPVLYHSLLFLIDDYCCATPACLPSKLEAPSQANEIQFCPKKLLSNLLLWRLLRRRP
jgi:hypothetical protein